MSRVVLASTFATSKLSVSAPKVLKSGAKQSYLNYEGQPLVMQSAKAMVTPFGLNVYDKSGPEQYSFELSFRNADTKPDVQSMLDAFTALDEFMIDEGVRNSKTWFKSQLTRDVVKAFYTPCVRYPKDKEGNQLPYPPTFKLKLRRYNDEFEAKFFDAARAELKGVDVKDILTKGAQVTVIMGCSGVWFAGSKYGLTWSAKQVLVNHSVEKLPTFAFQLEGDEESAPAPVAKRPSAIAAAVAHDEDEDDEIDDDEEFKSAPAAKVAPPRQPMNTDDAFADIDVEDGDDVEPAPAPKKPVVKRRVVAKK